MERALDRFVTAQAGVYADVVAELRRGLKTSHWIWFIFPQIEGLGASHASQRYAIGSLDEARAYLAHPILGFRLRECATLVLDAARPPDELLGDIDARKLRSSMTLFHRAAPDEPVFRAVLDRLFEGREDPLTTARLGD